MPPPPPPNRKGDRYWTPFVSFIEIPFVLGSCLTEKNLAHCNVMSRGVLFSKRRKETVILFQKSLISIVGKAFFSPLDKNKYYVQCTICI